MTHYVKLLFDHNLSPSLVKAVIDLYAGSDHVERLGMSTSSDTDIWNYALANDFVICTKDSGFHQRSSVFGHPPKVIWVRFGNCSTQVVLDRLRHDAILIQRFKDDPKKSFLELY